VFDDLHELRPGDKLSVEDDKGTVISFVVREIRSYDYNANAPEVFNSSDGKSHLNLITCEGVWNQATQNYSQRLVVFTDRE
jgi:sortase A